MTTKKDKPASIQKEYRKVSQLKNWDKNPRNIKEKDFERLKTQIRDLKQYKPLLITDDGIVLGGNMRLRAYRDLGIDDVWVSVVDAPDEEAKMRYALSDNDRAGYYDGDMLANLTGEYPDFNWEDYAVDLNEPQTLDELIKSLAPIEEDDVPEVSDEPAVSELGEVYQLGRHRLMCGDATKIEDVEKLMNGQKADMVFHSPPYNAAKDGHLTNKVNGFDTKYQNSTDALSDEDYLALLVDSTNNSLLVSDYVFVNLQLLTHNRTVLFKYQTIFADLIKDILIWNKQIAPPNIVKGAFNTKWEYVFAISKDNDTRGFPCNWQGKYPNVIETENNSANQFADSHKAGYPIAFPVWLISKMDFAKSVLDLFGGSGSTLIACEQTNRTCYMMELDPKYCDVIRKRYENFINKEDR